MSASAPIASTNVTGKKRYFVDVTATYFQGGRGGIPRVARSLVEAFRRRPDIEVIPFVQAGERFYRVDDGNLSRTRQGAMLLRRLRAAMRVHDYPIAPLYSIANSAWGRLNAAWTFLLALCGTRTAIDDFAAGDVVLLTYVPRFATFERVLCKANRGATVACIVHDLFPLQYPQQFIPEVRRIFKQGTLVQFRVSDIVLAISDRTARAVRDYQKQNGFNQPVTTVYLGADPGKTRPRRKRDIPTLLSVGTCEPRKNYAYALSICEKLWAAGEPLHYVVVGAIEPSMPHVAAALTGHPEYGRRLFHYPNADDDTLGDLYASSDFLLSVSVDEGFGLPAMEAWQHGLPPICSDIEVYRELRPDALFIPLGDAGTAAEAIRHALRARDGVVASPERPHAYRSWDECADELRAAIEAL